MTLSLCLARITVEYLQRLDVNDSKALLKANKERDIFKVTQLIALEIIL